MAVHVAGLKLCDVLEITSQDKETPVCENILYLVEFDGKVVVEQSRVMGVQSDHDVSDS